MFRAPPPGWASATFRITCTRAHRLSVAGTDVPGRECGAGRATSAGSMSTAQLTVRVDAACFTPRLFPKVLYTAPTSPRVAQPHVPAPRSKLQESFASLTQNHGGG